MRAFTLTEALVATFIFILIIGAVLAITRVASLSWTTNSGVLELAQGARQAMDGMTRESRQSRPQDLAITNGGARLDFNIPSVAPVISYYVLNNQLIREYPPLTTKVLANNISSILFCCAGGADCADCASASMLQIQIIATKTKWNIPLSFALTQKIKLRNE